VPIDGAQQMIRWDPIVEAKYWNIAVVCIRLPIIALPRPRASLVATIVAYA
jgi:hypothetical protein